MDNIKLAERTIALLASMIDNGEQHTARSREMVDNALNGLKQVKNLHIQVRCGALKRSLCHHNKVYKTNLGQS